MYIKDVKLKPFDFSDTYQQVEIIQKRHSSFTAVSVASDGNPPMFLRRKYWYVSMSRPHLYNLNEASSLNSSLPARLPNFDFSTPPNVVVVGKWYCPFVFVKGSENVRLKDQMNAFTFYEVTLEQRWEKIFGVDRVGDERKAEVSINVFVEGKKSVREERRSGDGVIWFGSCDVSNGEEMVRIGLSTKIIERMKWEEERGGWVDENEKLVRERREKFDGSSDGWIKFGCYVLAKMFVFKSMDNSTVLEFDFKHTHQIRCKWE